MMYPKTRIVRSASYRRWVASTHCRRCKLEGFSQAAHPNHGKGLAMKTSDDLCFALCGPRYGILGCHMEHDLCLGMTREQRRAKEQLYIADQQMEALECGRPEFAKEAA